MIALRFVLAAGAGMLLTLVGTANAAPIPLFNTGTTAEGSSDPHWTLTGTNPGNYGSALTVASSTAFPLAGGTWLANNNTSRWLVPNGTQGDHAGSSTVFYNYTTTFDMTGLAAGTGTLTFQYAVDNAVDDVVFNGVSLKTAPYNFAFGNNSFTTFSGTYTVNSGFNSGFNTLIFRVINTPTSGNSNPVGLNVRFTNATAAVVPEGNTAALLGAALPLLGTVALRRRKK